MPKLILIQWHDGKGTFETAPLTTETIAVTKWLKQKQELSYTIVSATPNLNLDVLEKEAILNALELTNWRQFEAAKLLGITPRQINYKVKKHGIYHKSWLRHNKPKGPEE